MNIKNDADDGNLNRKQFYRELGQLLYAVAVSDETIRKQERRAMQDLVLKELAHAEHSYDSSGMNKAFYTSFEFDELERNHVSAAAACNSFIGFYRANSARISESMRNAALKAIESVASAYRKVNRQEREILETIRREFRD
jgi:hypothetical protein